MEKDWPVTPTLLTVIGVDLEFTTEMEALALFPTATLPRLTVLGDTETVCSVNLCDA
jgi:hypothetical protein